MPFYEYRCSSCGHEFEAMQKISDPPLTDCPACGKGELAKLVSAAGFRLKGTGWYATDFKNKPKPAQGAAAGKDDKGNGTAKADAGKSGAESTASGGAKPGKGSGTDTAAAG